MTNEARLNAARKAIHEAEDLSAAITTSLTGAQIPTKDAWDLMYQDLQASSVFEEGLEHPCAGTMGWGQLALLMFCVWEALARNSHDVAFTALAHLDQEGVRLGKKLLASMLERGEATIEEIPPREEMN